MAQGARERKVEFFHFFFSFFLLLLLVVGDEEKDDGVEMQVNRVQVAREAPRPRVSEKRRGRATEKQRASERGSEVEFKKKK